MPDKDLVFLTDHLHLVPASKRVELLGRTPRADARTLSEVRSIVNGERLGLGLNRCLAAARAGDRTPSEIRAAVLHVAKVGGRRAVELLHGASPDRSRRVTGRTLPYLADAGPMDPDAAVRSFGRLVKDLEDKAERSTYADLDDGHVPLDRLRRWRASRVAFLADRLNPSMGWDVAMEVLRASKGCAYSTTMGRSAKLEAFAALHPDRVEEIAASVGMPVVPPRAANVVDGHVRDREAAAGARREIGEATWAMLRVARMRSSDLDERDAKVVEDIAREVSGPRDTVTDARRSALQRVFVANRLASTDLETLFARLARVETMREAGDMLADVDREGLAGDVVTAIEALDETRARLVELSTTLVPSSTTGPAP